MPQILVINPSFLVTLGVISTTESTVTIIPFAVAKSSAFRYETGT